MLQVTSTVLQRGGSSHDFSTILLLPPYSYLQYETTQTPNAAGTGSPHVLTMPQLVATLLLHHGNQAHRAASCVHPVGKNQVQEISNSRLLTVHPRLFKTGHGMEQVLGRSTSRNFCCTYKSCSISQIRCHKRESCLQRTIN
jgi:hypothetical protein